MNKVTFTDRAWDDYIYWQTQDRRTLRRINTLINDIKRNGYEGVGKPEALIGDFSGYWSRRIDEKNRIIYRINNDIIELYELRSHYGQ